MGRMELLWRSLRKRGVARTIWLVVSELIFDLSHGTDTSAPLALSRAAVESSNRIFGEQYQAANPSLVRSAFAAVERLGVSFPRSTLVDFGCGKGRVMILAIEAGFGRVIGVDFSQQLCSICLGNLSLFAKRFKQGRLNFDICNTDAVDFEIPVDANVFFFFNPFKREVLQLVAERIRNSYSTNPRSMHVIYLNPVVGGVFEGVGFEVVYQLGRELVVFGSAGSRTTEQ